MEVQLRAIFSGRVQGVGFRFQTDRIARNFDVKGYVQNLADGTVELVAEGEKQELLGLLDAIRTRMDGNIRESTESWCSASGQFDCFGIRR